jgi:hypothetical protein
MPQLVFIHGPGAGASADANEHHQRHFSGSLAPTQPGHHQGTPRPDDARYNEWVSGWRWGQGKHRDQVLDGDTLGASISLQYRQD